MPADVRRAPQSVSDVVASSHDGPEESINGEEVKIEKTSVSQEMRFSTVVFPMKLRLHLAV